MVLISYMIFLMFLSISVGFFSLLERKSLSYLQIRVGPMKVGYKGLIQPFADGGKLFMKEYLKLISSDLVMFLLMPVFGMVLCMLFWGLYIYGVEWMDFNLGMLFFFCISGIGVYIIIFSGWSSNSVYGMIGSYRGVAQSISYEVMSMMLILGFLSMVKSYSVVSFSELSSYFLWLGWGNCLLWLSVLLIESGRSPYDFAEGESELVSGYNIEYSSIGFSLLFMSEYGNIMFMCYVSGIMFWGGSLSINSIWFSMLMFLVVWIRGSFPRMRYDKLMSMAWKEYLVVVLGMLIFIGGFCSLAEIELK